MKQEENAETKVKKEKGNEQSSDDSFYKHD